MSYKTALTVRRPLDVIPGEADILALADEWLAALALRVRAGELTVASQRTYSIGMGKFIDWCTSSGVQQASSDTIREWKASMRAAGAKPGSVNTWFGGIRAFFAWAVEQRRLAVNPATGVKTESRDKSRRHKRDALTDEEVRRLLAQPDISTLAGKRDRAILALMLFGAARTVEAHRANLENIQTAKGRMVISVQGKGREESDDVIVLANPKGEAAMYDWMAVHPITRGNAPLFVSLSNRGNGARLSLSSIRALVKGYLLAAGIRSSLKTTHSLRHSAATSALAKGAPITKVQSMLRHADLKTTLAYVHELDRVENPAEQFIDYDRAA